MFRSGSVAVYNGDKILHLGAKAEYVHNLVDDLFKWGESSEVNPLIKSSVIHYEIETIHPFADGNGRIGRLWQSVILYNYNKLFELIPIETLIYENQQKYYQAIEDSRKVNSSTTFIGFMLVVAIKSPVGLYILLLNVMFPLASLNIDGKLSSIVKSNNL